MPALLGLRVVIICFLGYICIYNICKLANHNMVKVIKLRKGLNINLKGVAGKEVKDVPVKGTFAICPDDFYGFKPKVTVKEGDTVKAGDALFVNKDFPEVKFVSPVSGTVKLVNRGERRKVLDVRVEADSMQESVDYGAVEPSALSAEDVKKRLLESGVFSFIKQRPYDITANPKDMPKAVFVSAFNEMPLAADFDVVLSGREQDFQTGINALAQLAPVYLGISPKQTNSVLAKTENAEVTVFDGPNPAGNVGVQINHISPVNKNEIVWTVGAEEVIFIGRVFNTGKVDLTRVIAFAGYEVKNPCYYRMKVGADLSVLTKDGLKDREHVRILNGNPLIGKKCGKEAFLAVHATEVTVIPEGDDVNEVLGWIKPRLKDFSTNRSYFSWLQGKKFYNLDARVKGGERHIIMGGEYDKVFPMDIFAGYLIKAILVGDIDRMEQLGIYEVVPEDFAVAEFIDSSKLELQRIVREGLDMFRKEMA